MLAVNWERRHPERGQKEHEDQLTGIIVKVLKFQGIIVSSRGEVQYTSLRRHKVHLEVSRSSCDSTAV